MQASANITSSLDCCFKFTDVIHNNYPIKHRTKNARKYVPRLKTILEEIYKPNDVYVISYSKVNDSKPIILDASFCWKEYCSLSNSIWNNTEKGIYWRILLFVRGSMEWKYITENEFKILRKYTEDI